MKDLQKIIARLRRDCPWDRKQTVFSVQHNVLEEAYELAEAIRGRNYQKIKEEIGDYLFVGLFLARILEDEGKTTTKEILDGIARKLMRRHPHVLGSAKVRNAEEVVHNWNQIKAQEKGRSILDGVPKALPALQRAASVQVRAKRVGFDWKDPRDVLAKVVEEVEEIRAELRGRKGRVSRVQVREELGDLLFAIVNMARHLDIDAEDALQRATTKFTGRFQKLEREFARQGKRLPDARLDEMDAVWEKHKRKARKEPRTADRRR